LPSLPGRNFTFHADDDCQQTFKRAFALHHWAMPDLIASRSRPHCRRLEPPTSAYTSQFLSMLILSPGDDGCQLRHSIGQSPRSRPIVESDSSLRHFPTSAYSRWPASSAWMPPWSMRASRMDRETTGTEDRTRIRSAQTVGARCPASRAPLSCAVSMPRTVVIRCQLKCQSVVALPWPALVLGPSRLTTFAASQRSVHG
jgi:hypothetical protein